MIIKKKKRTKFVKLVFVNFEIKNYKLKKNDFNVVLRTPEIILQKKKNYIEDYIEIRMLGTQNNF